MQSDMEKETENKWFGLWKKLKGNDRRYLKVFLIFFVAGNVFFFCSNVLFRGTTTMITLSKFHEDIVWNERVLQLERWNYDKDKALMEIEISIKKNDALDGVKNYEYKSNEYNEGALKVKAVAETDDMLVIQISGVPKRYTIVSLHINIPGIEEENDFVVYGDPTTISETDIETKTAEEYQADKTERIIDGLKEQIQEEKNDIKDEEATISNGEERIEELKAKLDYQTETEKEKTQSQITEIESRLEVCWKEIMKSEDNITEYEEQIEKETELLKKYRGE